MDTNVLEGKWQQIRGDIKTNWGKLTNQDLEVIGGRRDRLEGVLREKYGYTADRVREEVDDYLGELDKHLDRTAGKVKARAHDAQAKLADSAERAGKAVKQRAEQAGQALEEVASRVPEPVATTLRERPWVAVGALVLVAVAIAMLLRQRSM